jgi:glycosyltransferase involved in cell wall biosynthesis
MNMSVSIALCTHNGARYLEQQLRSILEQTTGPQQIVISDDASTDGTVALAEAVLARYDATPGHSPIDSVILRNEVPLGVARNFESAILATSGDLIALSDQDDVWRPDRLARVLNEFDSRADLDLVFSNARLVDGYGSSLDRTLFDVLEISGSDTQKIHDSDALPLFIKRNLATGATIMFRRHLLTTAVPFPSHWVHDEWLGIMAAATGRLEVVDEPLIDYRQHGSNVIGVEYPTLRRKVQRTLEPRGGRNERVSRKFEQFAERLESLGSAVPSEVLALARDKSTFETERAGLPTARLRRLAPIIAANRQGRYAKFASQGRLDMVRDLLQPHGQ